MNTSFNNNPPSVIPIMHCFDNNYVVPASASFYSMLKHACPQHYYKLYVLHSDITVQNQVKLTQIVNQFPNASLEFIFMANRFDELWNEVQFSGHYAKEVLYKLLVASIFPQYEKLIITDVDVIFLGDISQSYFSFDAQDEVLFAGVHHIQPKGSWLDGYYQNYDEHFGVGSSKKLKICGGYLVANLHQLRLRNMEETFISFFKENAYRLLQSEQDIINFCCDDADIKFLPLNYVVCTYQYDLYDQYGNRLIDDFYSIEEIVESCENPIQLHYATGIKPWNDPASSKADIWYHYLSEGGMFFDYTKKQKALNSDKITFLSNDEIRNGNKENGSPLMVSILCCTYNHEKFIRDALESLVNQKTDFAYEIIVADDCSTDSTPAIIREYQEKYPALIHPILRETNVGIGENYYDALCHVQGRFLAICDGDDCWIDDLKLKKQVDFLAGHPEYNVCCASCIKHNIETGETFLYNPIEYIQSAISQKDYYSFEDLLYCRFITSNTVMFRWQLRDRVPEFLRSYSVIDFPLALIHAAGGKIKVMEKEVFAKYTIHSGGITSTQNTMVENQTFCLINEVNEWLDYRLSRTVQEYMTATKNYMAWVRQKEKATDFENAEINNKKKISDFLYEIQSSSGNPVSVHLHGAPGRLAHAMSIIYMECVPNVIKRLWRLSKKGLIILYLECVPNIIQRLYRKCKRILLRRIHD